MSRRAIMEFSGLLKCILGTDRAGKAKAYVRGNPSTEIACDVRHLIAANDTANTDKKRTNDFVRPRVILDERPLSLDLDWIHQVPSCSSDWLQLGTQDISFDVPEFVSLRRFIIIRYQKQHGDCKER
jgi:hypothetical protein